MADGSRIGMSLLLKYWRLSLRLYEVPDSSDVLRPSSRIGSRDLALLLLRRELPRDFPIESGLREFLRFDFLSLRCRGRIRDDVSEAGRLSLLLLLRFLLEVR